MYWWSPCGCIYFLTVMNWQKGLLTGWLLSLLLFRKCSGKTINVAYIKKALAMSQPILKPKMPRLLSQDCFCTDTAVHTAASVQDFKWQRRHKDDRPPTPYASYCSSSLLSLSKSEDGAGWHLVVTGEHQDELGWGHWIIAKDYSTAAIPR